MVVITMYPTANHVRTLKMVQTISSYEVPVAKNLDLGTNLIFSGNILHFAILFPSRPSVNQIPEGVSISSMK